MSCTGWTNLKQLFGLFFGIPKNCLKFSDLKPPLEQTAKWLDQNVKKLKFELSRM